MRYQDHSLFFIKCLPAEKSMPIYLHKTCVCNMLTLPNCLCILHAYQFKFTQRQGEKHDVMSFLSSDNSGKSK